MTGSQPQFVCLASYSFNDGDDGVTNRENLGDSKTGVRYEISWKKNGTKSLRNAFENILACSKKQ
jgi:hypothetical protein